MERTILRPIIDPEATGKRIRFLRKQCDLSVRDLQIIFGFEYPQAIYAWEQGKNIPTIDNLLVLSQLFGVTVDQIIERTQVQITVRDTPFRASA